MKKIIGKNNLLIGGFLATVFFFVLAGHASAVLNVSCSALPNPALVSQPVTFSSNVSGGAGPYIYAWSFACIGNQSTCQNSFSSPGNYVAYLAVSSDTESQTVSCFLSVNQNCVSHDHKVCSGQDVFWYDSCGNKEDLFQTCGANQACQSGACVNIACSANSGCGTNGFTGSPFCQGNSIYQDYITYTCHNPGTANSSCTNSTVPQLKQNCLQNQLCSSGQCGPSIACFHNYNCGIDGYVGNFFCQSGNVYQNYRTYTCNNPGTPSSNCSNTTNPQIKQTCPSSQTCSGGNCVNIACNTNAGCGADGFVGNLFCQSGNVYQNYRTYTCNNPGMANSSCTNSINAQLKNTCGQNQTCSNGSCSNIVCSQNSDCGANGYVDSPFCQSGNVYQNYKTYVCNNPGTPSSNCSNTTNPQIKQTCSSGQTCSGGSCINIVCSANSDCGTSGYIGSQYCQGNNVYQDYRTYICNNPGTANANCTNSTSAQLKNNCLSNQTCSNGQCSQQNISAQTNSATNIYNNQATLNGYLYGAGSGTIYVWFQWGTTTSYGNETTRQQQNYAGSFSQNINLYSGNYYHFRAAAQDNYGNTVYGQDMTFTAGSTQNFLTISKTVRNMTTGNYNWSNSVYASPSDVLMFMITIQTTGNQNAQNVFVRDYLPSNLIYKNQLVVSGSSNYSGDIISGINFGAITAGQSITITYQAQLAPAQNFNYGTNTLNNSVSVTSSNSGYNPTSNATIFVNRTGVLGASSISTGLTNNFWLDSFFLPLLIALAGVWIFRSGILRIGERLDYFKSRDKDYKANKELKNRISKIQKTEPKS